MHWIQYHILLELTRYSQRRYSELRPEGVESNLFQYYLERLLKEKRVEKTDRAYRLTAKGREFASTLSLQSGRPRRQPQILTALICRNEKGEYLLTRWKREPNSGLVSFLHGMMHYGHTIAEMAAIELAEKAGMSGEFGYRGEVAVRGYENQEVVRHMIVHIMEATNLRSDRPDQLRPELGEPFWTDLRSLSDADFVPGFYHIARLAEATPAGTIFAEIDVTLG